MSCHLAEPNRTPSQYLGGLSLELALEAGADVGLIACLLEHDIQTAPAAEEGETVAVRPKRIDERITFEMKRRLWRRHADHPADVRLIHCRDSSANSAAEILSVSNQMIMNINPLDDFRGMGR